MTHIKIIVEKHADGYVAYPLGGLKGVVVGEGDTYEEALADAKSAIQFHIETFGADGLQIDSSAPDTFTRRDFLIGASTLIGGCFLEGELTAQSQQKTETKRALNDPNVIHGKITFKSGSNIIDGYLSRPKAEGKYPIVIVVAGNTISEEYIPNTTALLAQNGFVGLAPNIYHLQAETMTPEEKRKVFSTQITDELIFQDIEAGVHYLKQQSFVKKKIGITGFCFGGRCALMFATKSKEISAVVPFYGNLVTPPEANRQRNPVDMIKQIKVPVQGHYAKDDKGIAVEQVKKFEEDLRRQGTTAEMFFYDASHGFFAYTRPSFNQAAADLAWVRTVDFFKKYLK